MIGESLVKCKKFDKPSYIGDPINTVRIFNELEVDELCFLDVRATLENRKPNMDILRDIASECFMPLSYGGGIKDVDTALKILSMGFEKIVLNTVIFDNPQLVKDLAKHSGVQSVIGSIDVKKNLFGKYSIYSNNGRKKQEYDVIEWAKQLEQLGVGEILLSAMDKEATWLGFDDILVNNVSSQVSVPVIANCGAGNVQHIQNALKAGASAVCLGSMVVYQQKGMGVLINMPEINEQ